MRGIVGNELDPDFYSGRKVFDNQDMGEDLEDIQKEEPEALDSATGPSLDD